MGRPSKKPIDPTVFEKPAVRAKIYVRQDIIGMGKIEVLQAVADTGSISAAAKKIGLGYRRAWYLLETLQNCFEKPLFTAERGGANAGGTTLTPLGQELVTQFITTHTAIETAAAPLIDWLTTHQKAP